MGKKYDVEYFQEALAEAQEKCFKKSPNIKSSHRQSFVEACEVFYDGYEKQKKAAVKTNGAEHSANKCAKEQEKAMKKCMKAAAKIFEKLTMTESGTLQTQVLKGSIILHSTPEALAAFCEEDKKNGKLIDTLFKDSDLMKEMLTHGGAKKGNYGQAMKIYSEITKDFPEVEDEITNINKKIAMAVALELASPIHEFDTKVNVDPVKRYNYYAEAYKNGELDPAFPHFSVWELRHVVDCDAPDDQIQWGRDMLMNYAPYITSLTDETKKYLYILETDVLMRNPTWTSSPRTYQQVLSGGGKDTPNAWFGRFICKAFGIPTWGCKQPGRVGLTRWTSEGWVAERGANWETCEWEGVRGVDFKGEVDARSTHSPDEYFRKLVLLECLAGVLDSRRDPIPEDEKTIPHPLRMWRSLAIIQKALMLVPASPEVFQRTGEGVKTNVEKYLEAFELDEPDDNIKVKKGTITIPGGASASSFGNVMVIESFGGGKQINFLGPGNVDFDIPDKAQSKTYTLTMDVCTVHLKQAPLLVSVDHAEEKIPIEVPYTIGEWQKTKGVAIELSGRQTISFIREKPCFGLAIKKIYLE